MSQYRKLAHTTYLCQYHVVFCPKYRKRVLEGKLGRMARDFMRQICEWKGVEIEEGHVARDRVHLVLSIPPKFAVSDVVGLIKGRSAIRLFKHVPKLRGGYRQGISSAQWVLTRRLSGGTCNIKKSRNVKLSSWALKSQPPMGARVKPPAQPVDTFTPAPMLSNILTMF